MSENQTAGGRVSQNLSYPPGIYDALRFQGFNFLAVQVVLGSPMILYAKTLNASATMVGIIAGMLPFLVVFQIPAVHFINRIGYKRFVLGGWGLRHVFIFGLALVPLATGHLHSTTQLMLILTMLFGFNLLSNVAGCAWMPWLASLVPANLLGKYLSRDTAMAHLGSFVTIILAAVCLGADPHPWQFAVLFSFSGLMGLTSLIFLRRIPDATVPEQMRTSQEPVPWLHMLRHRPFRKLLWFILAWAVAMGGLGAFIVAFLKVEAGLPAGKIMLVTSVSFLGGLSSMWLLGHRLDHLGSKPMLGFALGGWLLILAGWIAVAGGALTANLPLICLLQFFMGFCGALIGAATNRLVMTIIPAMGRNHFFALYSVIANVTLGLAPIGWGLLIDAVGGWHGEWLGLTWNRFTIFFAAAAVVFAITRGFARRLEEPQAVNLEKLLTEFLIKSPQRLWLRFWPGN
jgi:MFS family permease